MTNKQLKNLKDTLWTTADQLRANSGLKSHGIRRAYSRLDFPAICRCKI